MDTDKTEVGRSPDGSGYSPKGGAASSTASPAKPSIPNADWIRTNLTHGEASAFLALFAGAWTNLKCFVHGETGKEMPVSFGKAECEWVPFRETWQHRFPSLGLTTFTESEPRPALGMVSGSTWTEIKIGLTDFGWDVRDAHWARPASGMEAATAGETSTEIEGSTVGDSPTAESGDAQPSSGSH